MSIITHAPEQDIDIDIDIDMTTVLHPTETERPTAPRGAPEQPRRTGLPWRHLPVYAALPAAVLLWLLSLRFVRLNAMGDYGLIAILPILFWIALGLLTLGFAASLNRTWVRTPWLLGHVIALIVMLHATPTILYGTLRYSWAWKHVAVIDYLLRHNGVDGPNSQLSAYYQWPGFFSLNAEIVRLAGLKSALTYAAWGPPINNLLMIAPLVLILRTMTRDRRILWGTIWLFYSCAWTGQDYFSPQAFAFTLFLAILGVVLNRTAADHALTPEQPRPRRAGNLIWILLLLPLVAAIDSSHQLTPLMLILALAILALSRYRGPVLLWTLAAAAVFALAWDATVGLPYIRDNVNSIIDSFGSLDANATAPLNGAATASNQQQVIAYVDTGAALLVALLAIAAVILNKQLRRSSAFLLTLAPLPMLAANNYGGEVIFRVYLFALPAAAFLNRTLLLPAPSRPWTARLHTIVFPAVLLLLLAAFVVPYYGKESENYFSPDEIAATDFVYSTAPHGSTIIAAASDYPGGSLYYDYFKQISWLDQITARQRVLVEDDPLDALKDELRSNGSPAYFILTRSQIAEIQTAGLLPTATLQQLERIPNTPTQFTVVYRNADAMVLKLTQAPTTAPGGNFS
ncbi:hypothetical protein [Actinospica sp.]|jgi:hypothetical protein|uniref:hypothetical protein n=1 Tax=Actinospica sp. TaxID=1872142 RepID=UPI002B5BC53C|nr:hypothetical protein [Actinospica sp.]HWG25850.1 hypothetical protein [Actinospica sp.]